MNRERLTQLKKECRLRINSLSESNRAEVMQIVAAFDGGGGQAQQSPAETNVIRPEITKFTGEIAGKVTQEHLEEVFCLANFIDHGLADGDFERADECAKDRAQKIARIEQAIRAGAFVEEGTHDAKLLFDRSSGCIRLEIS